MAVLDKNIILDSPWDGDLLNRHDGAECDGALTITVRGRTWPGATVTLDSTPANVRPDGSFEGPARLTQREQTVKILAQSAARSGATDLRLVWDAASRRRYRFSIDDNVQWLRDLAAGPDDYQSLFDHWYLRFWRNMHEQFGAKIHMNIYYSDGGDFTLQQVPEKWRDEFADNASWLHLTFHARADKPDRIYKDASYEEMAGDIARVHEQIRRFAGEEVMSRWTTVHWAECPRDAARAVHDAGYRGLIILAHVPGDTCTTKYYLSAELCDHIAGRDAWKDFDLDLLFINCDQVVNSVALGQVRPRLEEAANNSHTGELMELLIHEQYFRRELERHYQPDVMDKVRTALQFVTERGYEPVFWADEFLAE
ncbi:MAG: hypothetical protein AB7W28_10360 [Armatimonadota bacterium]